MLEFLFCTAGLIFSFGLLRALFCLRWAQRLAPLRQPLANRPRVSVVLAARDEEARVEQTLRHILAQEHIDLEVIPVSDRARDRTDCILKLLAVEDSRVHSKRVNVLPERWLGKCHACHVGASSATGDWILFTDADCWLKPDVIARAIAIAEQENVDHVTLTPGVAPQTLPAEAWHIAFLVSLADWFARVNQDKSNGHLGIGAFNLIRTSLYKEFGGYEALRLCVVDDIKLGQLVRRAGGRTRAFIGGDDVECHWGVTVPSMIKIMEKNFFAALDYRTIQGIFFGVVLNVFWAACVIGPFTGSIAGFCAAASLIFSAIPAAIVCKRLRWPLRGAAFTPFAFAALYYAVLNSTIVTLRQKGIRWRDTFYSLEMLRAGNVL